MTTIPDLHVGHGITLGPVTMFPVWADAVPLRDVVTGTAARVGVTELPDGAAVPHLTVTNLGSKPALLLEGELLEGGLQTRALAFDLLIAPRTSAVVDVACVEQGRWGGASSHARRARRASASVQHRLRGDKTSRQLDVWASVARFDRATGPTSTGSFADHLDRVAEKDVEAARVLPGQTGVIIGVAGWPVTIELFGSPSALLAHLPGILAAARLDALLAGRAEPVPASRARRFAAAVTGLPLDFTPVHAGDGHAAAGHADSVAARGIATPDGALAHLSALNLRHELIGAA
jgi:ARG/rhodanese/phosphatase superfamily protein